MDRLRRMPWWLPLALLSVPAVRAETELVRVGPGAAESQPAGAGAGAAAQPEAAIYLFGHHQNSRSANLPESERELRRPDAAVGSTRAASESSEIARRSRGGAAWSYTDLMPLGVVLGLIILVAAVIKKYLPNKGLVGSSGGLLEVVARTPVSPKQSVTLVRIGRRFLLLGVSPERITTLCMVDDAQGSAELMADLSSRRPDSSASAFAKSFNDEAGEFDEESDEFEPNRGVGGSVRGLLEKVRQMKKSRVA